MEEQREEHLSNKPKPTSRMGAIGHSTLSGIAKLLKLLPAGTVFAFQFLNPVLSNNGHCDAVQKALTSILVALCGISCCFSSFTDSYTGADGRLYYGIVTPTGLLPLWDPNPKGAVNLSPYKMRVGDFVHAAYSLAVFSVISLLDPNTVSCFYPSFEAEGKTLLAVLPPVVGGLASFVNFVCPKVRHGIGYLGAPASG